MAGDANDTSPKVAGPASASAATNEAAAARRAAAAAPASGLPGPSADAVCRMSRSASVGGLSRALGASPDAGAPSNVSIATALATEQMVISVMVKGG